VSPPERRSTAAHRRRSPSKPHAGVIPLHAPRVPRAVHRDRLARVFSAVELRVDRGSGSPVAVAVRYRHWLSSILCPDPPAQCELTIQPPPLLSEERPVRPPKSLRRCRRRCPCHCGPSPGRGYYCPPCWAVAKFSHRPAQSAWARIPLELFKPQVVWRSHAVRRSRIRCPRLRSDDDPDCAPRSR
jgi:hypothetical protein